MFQFRTSIFDNNTRCLQLYWSSFGTVKALHQLYMVINGDFLWGSHSINGVTSWRLSLVFRAIAARVEASKLRILDSLGFIAEIYILHRIVFNHSSLAISGTDWLEVPTIYKGYFSGDIPPEYRLTWYSTSILGSWNDHWIVITNHSLPGI